MYRTVCFSHGQDGEPWGTKILAMAAVARAVGWAVESLDYRGVDDPLVRAASLEEWCRRQPGRPVLVGSSMGGYVALAAGIAAGAAGLFLIAPALYVHGYMEILPKETPPCPVTIVHGWGDTVVPWQHSLQYGADHRSRLVLVDGDHRLAAQVDEIARLFRLFLEELPAG